MQSGSVTTARRCVSLGAVFAVPIQCARQTSRSALRNL